MDDTMNDSPLLCNGNGILDKLSFLTCVLAFVMQKHVFLLMWLLTFSALCVWLFPRHVEDGVVQLKETDEDVEGLEEEAVCLTDVLILSISHYNWQPLLWV